MATNRKNAKLVLQRQIVEDAKKNDTTKLFELISCLSDEEIWDCLSEENQQCFS